METSLTANPHPLLRLITRHPTLADSTKVKYAAAVTGYLATGAGLKDTEALEEYALGLSRPGRSFLKASIRLWAGYLARRVKAGATPENVAAVTATLYRLEALTDAIKVKEQEGEPFRLWLSAAEVQALLDTCDQATPLGQRDRLALGLLTGAGLRRQELVDLTWNQIKAAPVRGRKRTLLDIIGKGAKARQIPISDRHRAGLGAWYRVTGGQGAVICSPDSPGQALSPEAVHWIVKRAGVAIGKPELSPHDLRRTYAQLGYEAGVPLVQLSRLLGHANVATTQRYLNLALDLERTASDFVPF